MWNPFPKNKSSFEQWIKWISIYFLATACFGLIWIAIRSRYRINFGEPNSTIIGRGLPAFGFGGALMAWLVSKEFSLTAFNSSARYLPYLAMAFYLVNVPIAFLLLDRAAAVITTVGGIPLVAFGATWFAIGAELYQRSD